MLKIYPLPIALAECHQFKICSYFFYFFFLPCVISVQFSSFTQSCPTLCDAMDLACQASLSITNSQSLLKLISIELVMSSNHLILCRPLHFPSIFPSVRVFFNESVLHIRRPKYWSFSFSISPSNGYSGLISFKTGCFDHDMVDINKFYGENSSRKGDSERWMKA